MQIILLLAGIILGFIIGWLLSKGKSSALEERSSLQLQQINQLSQTLNEEREKVTTLTETSVRLETINQTLNTNLSEQKAELERINEKLKTDFENLANNILEK